jgi:hypothetical protein
MKLISAQHAYLHRPQLSLSHTHVGDFELEKEEKKKKKKKSELSSYSSLYKCLPFSVSFATKTTKKKY